MFVSLLLVKAVALSAISDEDMGCLSWVADKVIGPTDVVLSLSRHYLLNRSVIVYDHNFNGPISFDACIGAVVEFEMWMSRWNSRGKFVLAFSGNLTRLFEVAWRYYVYDLTVVQDGLVYTYRPYRYESADRPDLRVEVVGVCGTSLGEVVPLPKLWRNTTLRVGHTMVAPYVISLTSGVDVELFKEVFEARLGVQFEYGKCGMWGVRLDDGTYTECFGGIRTNRFDLGMGLFHTRAPQSFYEFDLTYPHFEDHVIWVVPAAAELAPWKNVLRIFDSTTWTAVLATAATLSGLWVLVCKAAPPTSPFYRTTWNQATVPLRFLAAELPFQKPTSSVLFVATWTFIFVTRATWEAHLLKRLTYTTYDRQIDSLAEILATLNIYVYPDTEFIYVNYDRRLGEAIKRANQFGKVPLDEVLIRPDFAVIIGYSSIMYKVPKYFVAPNGHLTVHLLKEVAARDYVTVPFRKGHPCQPAFDELVLYVRGAGLVTHSFEMIEHRTSLLQARAVEGRFGVVALKVRHMNGFFLLLAIGHGIALLAFCIELFACKNITICR